MPAPDVKELQRLLHLNIPISEQIGITIDEVSTARVVLHAPLKPNTNHNRTAFGGSVYAVAVLSGWALVTESVRDGGFHVDYVVVQDGKIDYLEPIEADFTAEAFWRSNTDREKFIKTLQRKGLARATTLTVVRVRGKICARLEARFVAQLTPPKKSVAK